MDKIVKDTTSLIVCNLCEINRWKKWLVTFRKDIFKYLQKSIKHFAHPAFISVRTHTFKKSLRYLELDHIELHQLEWKATYRNVQ